MFLCFQIDPRKYADGDREKLLDEPSFDYSSLLLPERSWQHPDDDDEAADGSDHHHHENKYCDVQCGHTCNYKAVSPSYLDNLVWRDSEVNHYYEPKLIIDLSNWKEQQSKEKAERKAKSKCERNGLVKAQMALKEAERSQQGPAEKDSEQEKHRAAFDFDSFIASTIRLSLQPSEPDVTLLHLNQLNSSVSLLEAPLPPPPASSRPPGSKSISQEKEEKCLVNLAQLGGGGGPLADAQSWGSLCSRPGDEGAYTGYLDHLFGRRDESDGDAAADAELLQPPATNATAAATPEADESLLGRAAEIVLNAQLDALADELPLKSLQASLVGPACAVKCSPQIAHKTYSSILKHLN